MRTGEEFERGGGDNAERAFAADKEVAQVVTGGIFVQRLEMGNKFAIGQDDFKPNTKSRILP